MNKHWVLGLAVLATLTACGRSTQLAVRAVSTAEDGEETGRAQEVIRLLPYDRDSIFAALTREASEPEPRPPADLIELRDSVSIAQTRWTEAEAAWNDTRSELQALRDRMDAMDRSSREYANAYRQFDDLANQERRLNRDKQRYFDTYTALQDAYGTRADSFNAVLQSWGDAAFEDYGEIVDSLIEARGEELVDTTDASGWAHFIVPRGRWWVHTRAELVFQELYWNVPYVSEGGVDTLVLNTSNARIRPIF
jgi:hypothetical protein